MAREIKITVTLKFSPRLARAILFLAMLLAIPLELGSETLTLSTTYPSPTGVYSALVATQTMTLKTGGNTVLHCTSGPLSGALAITCPGGAGNDVGLRVVN